MARYPVESEVTGTVWKVEVTVGDSVTEGDVLVIILKAFQKIPARPAFITCYPHTVIGISNGFVLVYHIPHGKGMILVHML